MKYEYDLKMCLQVENIPPLTNWYCNGWVRHNPSFKKSINYHFSSRFRRSIFI